MTKLTPALKITLIILTIILAIAAVATPIIIFTNANADINPADHPQPSTDQTPTTTTPNQNATPEDDQEGPTEEELIAMRDQQRRSDLARLEAAITQFQVNNNGRLPGHGSNLDGQGALVLQPSENHDLPSTNNTDNTAAKLITYYLNGAGASENSFVDPDGWTYGLTIVDYPHYQNSPERFADHMIYLIHQADCSAAGLASSDKTRSFALVYKLENGNAYCLDNQ